MLKGECRRPQHSRFVTKLCRHDAAALGLTQCGDATSRRHDESDDPHGDKVQEICRAVGAGCDAILLDLHGAMVTRAHDDGEGEPHVGAVLRTGWKLSGRVLRPAMVKVTRG